MIIVKRGEGNTQADADPVWWVAYSVGIFCVCHVLFILQVRRAPWLALRKNSGLGRNRCHIDAWNSRGPLVVAAASCSSAQKWLCRTWASSAVTQLSRRQTEVPWRIMIVYSCRLP